MASTEPSIHGGELNAAITNALIGIHHQHFSRGPRKASTFHHGNVIVAIMEGVLTPAARRLVQEGYALEVRNFRQLFLKGLEDDCRAVVERLTGRGVIAFIGSHNPEADISAWIFTLDRDLGSTIQGPPRGAAVTLGDGMGLARASEGPPSVA